MYELFDIDQNICQSTPKTANSTRVIDIIDYLLPCLQSQYQLTGKNNTYDSKMSVSVSQEKIVA